MPIDQQDEHNTCPDCGHRLPHSRFGCLDRERVETAPNGVELSQSCGCTYGNTSAQIHAVELRIEAARKAHYAQGSGEND